MAIPLLLLLLLLQAAPAQGKEMFDPAVDPYPPPMPAEYGCAVSTNGTWMVTATGEYVMDVELYGFQFGSLQYQSVMAQMAGETQGVAVMQLSYSNYSIPANPTAGTFVDYGTQACYYNPIEGDASYPGPTYYSGLLEEYYNMGMTIYFSYVMMEGYGVCLQYSVLAPWDNPVLPRNITYTLTFQNSTGYLLEYILSGTEYCCFGLAGEGQTYCPNSGNCTDGSTPQQIYTVSGTYYNNYDVFSNWPTDFFTALCPFSTAVIDEEGSACSGATYSVGSMAGIVLSSLVGGALAGFLICYWLQRKSEKSLMNNVV